MSKKVNFLVVDLFEANTGLGLDHRELKDIIIDIIDNYADNIKDFYVLDLTYNTKTRYVADIFKYKRKYLFMRISNQKPSGSYLRRDYSTNIPENVLNGVSDDDEGLELYTYVLLDYATGILSIVNQKGAPNYGVINLMLKKYNDDYRIEFKPIPNPDGISRIYEAEEPKISMVEVEIPVPKPELLEQVFGWNHDEIQRVQGNGLKATMKISSIDRRIITDSGEDSRNLIDSIKGNLGNFKKAKIRAKASGEKTRDYSFFDENFSYPIDIPIYKNTSGEKISYSADELIEIYEEKLEETYRENKGLLISLADR